MLDGENRRRRLSLQDVRIGLVLGHDRGAGVGSLRQGVIAAAQIEPPELVVDDPERVQHAHILGCALASLLQQVDRSRIVAPIDRRDGGLVEVACDRARWLGGGPCRADLDHPGRRLNAGAAVRAEG